jgi:phage terminase large subunit-like protein
MLSIGLHPGAHPQCVIMTTPKPIKLLKQIIADPGTVLTRGSTIANAANLAPSLSLI